MSRLDVEARGIADAVKQSRFGCGHPHLPASFEPGEQRSAALRIEMGRNLIQQEDRRFSAPISDQIGVAKDESEQQRLLLTGRRLRGWYLLGAMEHGEVLPVRPFDSAARGGITRTVGAQRG